MPSPTAFRPNPSARPPPNSPPRASRSTTGSSSRRQPATSRVTRIESPARVQPGESFVLRVAAAGPDGNLPLALRRDGQPAGNAVITLRHGRGTVELTDRLPAAGAHLYEAEILPATDAHRGNNIARAWLEVAGGPRVVLITRYPDDPLAAAFQSQGLGVDILAEPSRANEGSLAGARAVVINNVPAFDLAPEFLRALDFFVREQGGGLLMAGGKHAFGAGGYFQSAIDPLLPVSMELKSEHRKLAVAMAIIMDRSGSMAASVPGPAGKPLTKMDLANSGAASAIDLLGIMDSVAVFAVDSSPHCIIPLTTLGERKPALINQVRKVQSMGGGIYVYEGLLAAWKELRDAPAGTRHVILFSDAADSEEPGQYKSLLAEMTKAGVTVSVIGLGTRADSDAKLLEDVAKRGNGRIQFTDRAEEIPRLFAQETVTVARSAFITDPVAAQPTGDWSEISGQPLAWLSEVDGYNLSYARPEAAVALTSKDEYIAPLVATMRRGLGRTAAVSFPLGGEYLYPRPRLARLCRFHQNPGPLACGARPARRPRPGPPARRHPPHARPALRRPRLAKPPRRQPAPPETRPRQRPPRHPRHPVATARPRPFLRRHRPRGKPGRPRCRPGRRPRRHLRPAVHRRLLRMVVRARAPRRTARGFLDDRWPRAARIFPKPGPARPSSSSPTCASRSAPYCCLSSSSTPSPPACNGPANGKFRTARATPRPAGTPAAAAPRRKSKATRPAKSRAARQRATRPTPRQQPRPKTPPPAAAAASTAPKKADDPGGTARNAKAFRYQRAALSRSGTASRTSVSPTSSHIIAHIITHYKQRIK